MLLSIIQKATQGIYSERYRCVELMAYPSVAINAIVVPALSSSAHFSVTTLGTNPRPSVKSLAALGTSRCNKSTCRSAIS